MVNPTKFLKITIFCLFLQKQSSGIGAIVYQNIMRLAQLETRKIGVQSGGMSGDMARQGRFIMNMDKLVKFKRFLFQTPLLKIK